MALDLRQQLKQTQQLLMSPQLQQAIKLLQMSRLDLAEHIQQELLENPFLEENFVHEKKEVLENDVITDSRTKKDEEGYSFQEVSDNGDWENYLGELSSSPKASSRHEYEAGEEISTLETRHATPVSLEAHLMWQLHLSNFQEDEVEIGEYIIGNLSSSGYLESSCEELAQEINYPAEKIEKVLKRIQIFDPVGVAARSPQECLFIQIEQLGYTRDPILTDLVKLHLEDLETHRYKPLLRKFRINMEELKEYIEIIQSLNPLPGATFGDTAPIYVSPDVYVFPSDGKFVILLNEDDLPAINLNQELCQSEVSEKEKDYTNKKISSATWLIKSLEQRRRTLYKVVESIVKFQEEFFIHGVSKLKPLILKDTAEDIEMHESSVSRITTNKYVATPHGTFELKFFFNSALSSSDGNQVGSESVKALIKDLISKEDPRSPLADEKICEILKEKLDLTIARRTVAKYRTALNIPSSSKRKEHL